MDEPWKHCTEWKKPATEDHIIYDSIDEMSRIGRSVETEYRFVVANGWEHMGEGEIGSNY